MWFEPKGGGGRKVKVRLYRWMNILPSATHWASKLLRTDSAELILAFITSSTSPEMKDCAVTTLAVSLSYTRKEKESGFHINLRNV